jgi:signal transduction histidine kinase
MSFRARLLLAFTAATLVPLALLAAGVYRQLSDRLVRQHQQTVNREVEVAREDLRRTGEDIATRLSALAASIAADDRLRLAVLRGPLGDRAYLLDWAGDAMRLAGLTMLQLQDEEGRIVSSGHFRNEFDRLEPHLPRALAAMPRAAALALARRPEGSFRVLARTQPVRVAGRGFDLVGGVTIDSAFLARLGRSAGTQVALVLPGAEPNDWRDAAVAHHQIPVVPDDPSAARAAADAELTIAHPLVELRALERSVATWFLAALAAAGLGALALSLWLSARLSRPLAALANATSTITLDAPDVALATSRGDEIGTLARRLAALSSRLRTGAAQLRAAERRVTMGEMARQVNHDVKNGLIPIRNVLRHLVQVQQSEPAALSEVFAQRRDTLESSITYLDALARNYAKLSPRLVLGAVDVNAVAGEVARSYGDNGRISIETRLMTPLPRVQADSVVLRRILENLVRNAIESCEGWGQPGRVLVGTGISERGSVRIQIADNGRGMSEAILAHAVDDFFTTKAGGTGLGLSVVRRLTMDLQGTLRIESAPGEGTTVWLEFPALAAR